MKCRVNYFLIMSCDVCLATELCKNGFLSAMKEHSNSTEILFFNSVDQQTDYTSLFLRPPPPPRRRMGGFGSGSVPGPCPTKGG
jgi:hypothetical protein